MKVADLKFKPGHYLSFVLASTTRSKLLGLFHPRYGTTLADHVTIEINPTPEKLEALKKELGGDPQVALIGFVWGEGIECATVSVNGKTERGDGGTYHLTYSLNPPRRPVDSNELLASLHPKTQRLSTEVPLHGELRLVRRA